MITYTISTLANIVKMFNGKKETYNSLFKRQTQHASSSLHKPRGHTVLDKGMVSHQQWHGEGKTGWTDGLTSFDLRSAVEPEWGRSTGSNYGRQEGAS